MSDPRVLMAMSLNFLIPLAIGGLLGRLLPAAKAQGAVAGASVGGVIVNTLVHSVDPSLRAIVLTEFESIFANISSSNNEQTVLQTSTTILARVLPEVPTATLQQIAQIISEFILTFEAGLSSQFTNVAESMKIAVSDAKANGTIGGTAIKPAVQPAPTITIVQPVEATATTAAPEKPPAT